MKLMIDIDDKVYEYIKSIPLHTMLEEAVIEGTPLDKVIENIKAEIEEKKNIHNEDNNIDYGVRSGLNIALKIIDKYIEKENEE